MTRYFTIHPENPQRRLISQTVEALRQGDLIVYPTDSSYAFGCALNNKSAVETIRTLRKLQPNHPLTFICSDIAQASQYAIIDDQAFSYLKRLTPGPYTFILPATKQAPKLVVGAKRKVVGIRIPNHPLAHMLVAELGEPILSSSLILPDEDKPVQDPHEIPRNVLGCVNLVLDEGISRPEVTTVVELIGQTPEIIREGAGDISLFNV